VLLDAVGLHRLERPDPDVERDAGRLHATRPERVEQLGRQVEPGRRRGDRARLPRVDGLVVLRVALVGSASFPVDVRRERRRPDAWQGFLQRGPREGDAVVARLSLRGHGAEEPGPEVERPARLRPAARLGEALPRRGVVRLFHEEELGPAPLRVEPEEAGGDDAGVVDDEEVARLEEARQVGDAPVRERARGAIERHEPRGAAGRGALGDRPRGKVEVEVGDVHGGIVAVRPFPRAFSFRDSVAFSLR
jgi:hypothetical protein